MKTASADPAFDQVRRGESLPEQIYRAVHHKVASGEIDPAVKLTETQLAAMLGVSRTPVREALARLRHEGLLQVSARGASVASLSRADLEEILELRLLIEPYAAAQAANRAVPDGVIALRAALAREVAAVPARSSLKFAMANHDFRIVLLALAGNRRLTEAATRHDSQIQALRRATLAKRAHRETVVRYHERVVDAVAAGDAQAAEGAMRGLMHEASTPILALATAHAAQTQAS